MSWKNERARVASLTRSRKPDDPDLLNARLKLKTLRLDDQVSVFISTLPSLSDGQRQRVARSLQSCGGDE
jgi:hypothetical protein